MGVAERKERERRWRRRQIREAALEVFSRKGYQAATMEEIAAEAELSKGVLYYYFPSKEVLYRSLVLEFTSEFYRKAWLRVEGIRDFRSLISALLDFHIEYFSSRKRELRLVFLEHFLSGRDGDLNWEISSFRKPLEERLRALSPSPWIMELFWTYILGISAKMLQGKSISSIMQEAEAFKKMIKGEIQ